MPAQLFLIDAHALCYRAFYAIRNLTASNGQATNAVYGFANALRKILRDYEPQYLAVCFDTKAKTRRQEKFVEYKIQRPKMPDDLISQIPLIQEVVSAYNLPIFAIEGYEADDVIATIARKMARKDLEVVIVSDDKDMFQLVNDQVKIFSSRQEKILDRSGVEELMGISPERIPDYIALAGDKIDNIPGVNGVGEVSALKLIKEYGALENIFKNVEGLSSKSLREKLLADKDMAFLSKELAVLEQVPLEIKLETMTVTKPDPQRLFELFSRLEFKKWAAEVVGQVGNREELVIKEVKAAKDADALVKAVAKNGYFAFSCEARAAAGDLFEKDFLMIALGGPEVYICPLNEYGWVRSIFENDSLVKITHNIKEKIKSLAPYGYHLSAKIFDVMLAGYVLLPGKSDYQVTTLAWDYLKTTVGDDQRAYRETSLIAKLYAPLLAELKEKGLLKLLEELELPLAGVLADMETVGVSLDVKLLEKMSVACHQKMDGLQKELFKIAGQEFNLNSPKQLSQVLFETLKLPVVKKTKTGFSTDEEVLTKLALQHDFPKLILEYRQLAKLQSTYIDALPKLVDPETKRLHASFDQAGTETGRLSSNNPNLQNIPIRTDLGREIRKAFIPSSSKSVILAADYSQIELRILAHLSGDENLHKAFAADQDIHNFTAALIFEVAEKEVTRQMRDTAKRVNFGISYGMSAYGLSKDLEISQVQAQDFIDRYFLRYPKVKTFMDAQIKKCEDDGFVTTLLNRRRYIPEIHSPNMGLRQFAQRQAINTPVQGSAADLIKLAMIKVHTEIAKRKLVSRMIITVHDELVFDVPVAEVKEMIGLVRQSMETTLTLSVPIRVTMKQGKNWLETEQVLND